MKESDSRVRKDNQGLYVGARKLWGTRSNVSVEIVREKIQGKLGSDESINEVVKVVREGAIGSNSCSGFVIYQQNCNSYRSVIII